MGSQQKFQEQEKGITERKKLVILNQTVRIRTSETYIGA
jgi:hypothetical protein